MSQPVPIPPRDVWSRFSVDPRKAPTLRASDADRDVAVEALNAAFQDGRLDAAEHADRLERALAAKQLADLAPLVADVVVSTAPSGPTPRRQRIRSAALRSWIGMAVLFNVIWAATWVLSANAPYYYWPIWPMIGTAVPALVLWVSGGSMANRSRPDDRDRRRLDLGR